MSQGVSGSTHCLRLRSRLLSHPIRPPCRLESPVKKEYWDVTDAQVVEKTGHPLDHWTQVLTKFGVAGKPSSAVVDHLQSAHGVPRYWARTLTTRYLKSQE